MTVGCRTAESTDQQLLRELFVQSRPDLARLPTPVRDSLIDMQYRAQRQHFDACYPRARHTIIQCDGVDVGRVILDDGPRAIRVVDITVSAPHRGRGIGTAVLRRVIADAGQAARAVELTVWSDNAGARALYQRLGFAITADDDGCGYVAMRRPPTEEGRRA